MNILIEQSIGLTSRGKQIEINDNFNSANLLTHEAIFLLSYKNFEPIKIKTSGKVFAKKSILAR